MGLMNSKSITGYLGGFIKFSNASLGQNEVCFGVRVDRPFYAQHIKNRGSVSNPSVRSELQQSQNNLKKSDQTTLAEF